MRNCAASVITTLACSVILCLAAGPAIGSTRVAAQQLVAVVLTNHAVSAKPAGRPVALLNGRRPITGAPTVLPVLSRVLDRSGQFWLRVRLPGRVTGTPVPPATGWIRASGTKLETTPWHLVVDLATRQLIVEREAKVVRRFSAIVGKPSTPTPPGQYFVEESVTLSKGQPGGPFALATSDRSNVLHEFDGGPGQIAIHGLANLGGQLGTAESHGCVRLANSAVTWLAARVGAGTPITII
jgi:lipoprotein-anchoring transpeptidase ErfK/SrfK